MISVIRSKQLLVIILSLFILLFGCRSADRNIVATKPLDNLVYKQTHTIVLTPSFTPTPNILSTPTATSTNTSTLTPLSTPSATISPGATIESPVDGMVMVYIPPGEFQMGSPETDLGADYDEKPAHNVYLDAYWIDQTVVTNAMYAVFLDEMDNQIEKHSPWLDAGDDDVLIFEVDGRWMPLQGYADYPVIEVTWFGAQTYCEWAGRRLPTEAEWEKAARAGSNESVSMRIYPWGDDIDCDKAQCANCNDTLAPANSNPLGASFFGVLGLSGNTWEWTADWYAEDFYAISPHSNPSGPQDGVTRVLRGGSWEYDWKHLRAANRRHNGPVVSMHDYGFRCVFDGETP